MQTFGFAGSGVYMKNRFGAFENSDTATIDGEREFGPLDVNQLDLSIKAAIP